MRPAHQLNSRKAVKPPRYHIFVDTETHETTDSSGDVYHVLTLGHAQYHDRRTPYENQRDNTLDFVTRKGFWDWCISKAKRGHTLNVWAHNAGFDMLVLGGFIELPARGWTMTSCIIGNGIFATRFSLNGLKISVLDSMNIFKTSLRKLGEDIGVLKDTVDFDTADLKQLMIYCRKDVTVLRVAVTRYLDLIDKEQLGKMGITVASQAMTAFRTRFYSNEIYIHDNWRAIKLERDAYVGARTEAFYIGVVPEHCYGLDINSMYPFVMHEYEYPVKLLGFTRNVTMRTLTEKPADVALIARVHITTPEPCFGIKRERLIFPIGSYWTVLTQPEIDYALEYGYIDAVSEVAAYKTAPIFRDYVDFFYHERIRYKAEKNGAFALTCKYLLNSLYGKFGQKAIETALTGSCPIGDIETDHIYDTDLGCFVTERRIGGRVIREVQTDEESYNSFPAIAAFVTAYARLYLWKLIKIAGRGNVFYSDTDSLFTNAEGRDNLLSYMDESKLGMLKVEKESDFVHIRDLKDYVFGDKSSIKGVGKMYEQLDENTFKGFRFDTVIGAIEHGRLDGIRLIPVEKHLYRHYRKGEVGTDGYVAPFVLDE